MLAGLAVGTAGAQDKPVDSLEDLRERARTDKKAVVASVVELTESEARVFWPVYNAYHSDVTGHYERVLGFIDTYAKAYDTMTDEAGAKLLNQFLARARSRGAAELVRPALSEGAPGQEGRAPLSDREQASRDRELRARARDSVRQIGARCRCVFDQAGLWGARSRARSSVGPMIGRPCGRVREIAAAPSG